MRKTFAPVMLLVASTACSTHYVPRAGPRLAIVMETGAPAYSKNGKVYKHGFAGSGLVEAVEDDPEALEAAETYQSRTVTGFLLVLAGSACLTASLVFLATRDPFDERDSTNDSLTAGTAVCGLGGYIAGVAVLASGQPYHFDAVNIYNDNVDKRRFRPPPGYGPAPWAQPIAYPTAPANVLPAGPVRPPAAPAEPAPTVPAPVPPPPLAPGSVEQPTPPGG